MKFTKMHGLGNDFILVMQDQIQGMDLPALAITLCARQIHIGADGLIIIGRGSEADASMRIFNSDGSEAEMCGNGIRCFARYVYDQNIVRKKTMRVSTLAGIMEPVLHLENGQVAGITVNMQKPSFEKDKIPALMPGSPLSYKLSVLGREVEAASVLMGVPHTVVFVRGGDELSPETFGPLIEKHAFFPNKTNVNFVEILGRSDIRITTWERGAGLTLACGTGSCASAVIAAEKGLTQKNVNVFNKTGKLVIEYKETGEVFMTGPAEYVFFGETMPQ